MAKVIAEHEEDLKRRLIRPEATFDDAVEAWLDYLEHEKRGKPATMRGYRTMVCSPQPSRPRGKPRKARLMRTFGVGSWPTSPPVTSTASSPVSTWRRSAPAR